MGLQTIITCFLLISRNDVSSYPHDYNGWKTGSSSLPRPSWDLIVGFDETTDTIWLLGGGHHDPSGTYGQLVQYQIQNDIFIDVNTNVIDYSTAEGNGQYYSQFNEYLFIISDVSLHRFNVINQKLDHNYYDMQFGVIYGGCLTTLDIDDGYLVITGGMAPPQIAMNTVQILNISSGEWLSNIASLNTARLSHTCNTYNNTVFVIGGFDWEFDDPFDTVEIYNLHDNEWLYLSDRLSTGMFLARSVVYQHEIATFGGRARGYASGIDDVYLKSITVIDGITHEIYPVTSCIDIDNDGFRCTAAINAAGTIYLFGGFAQLSSVRYVEPTAFSESTQCSYYQYEGRNVWIPVIIDVVPKSAGCYTMIVIVVIIMVSYLSFIVFFIIVSTKPSKHENESTEEEDKSIAKKQKIFGVLHAVSAIVPPIFYSKFTNSVFLGILVILFAFCQIIFQFVRHHLTSKNGKKLKMKSSILFVVVSNSLFNLSQGSAIIAGVNYDHSNTLILIISSWFAFLGQDLFSIILSAFLEVNEILYGVGAKAMYFFGFVQITSNGYIYASYLIKNANIDMNLHLFCDLAIEFAACALIIQLLYFIAGIIVFFRIKDTKQNTKFTDTVQKMDEANIEIPTCTDNKEDKEEVVYLQWRTEDVLEWIINLEDGKFKIYEETLRNNLETEKIDGEDIGNLDKSDLHRLGIKEFKLKHSLLQHIELLTKKENTESV